METKSKIRCIACSVFKNALKQISPTLKDEEITYLDSMLHMHPSELQQVLSDELTKSKEPTLILFGDCTPKMNQDVRKSNIQKIPGVNCIDIMLGETEYKKLKKGGAFFLMAEWTYRWKEVFEDELGLNPTIAPDFFNDLHNKFTYLDDGSIPVPIQTLEEIKSYANLDYEIYTLDMDIFKQKVRTALKKLLNK
jgi:hypothetical protein